MERGGPALLQGVAALEALHAAGGVNDALLAGEERMAFATDFGVQLRTGRARLERVAARADGRGLNIGGMNLCLHRYGFPS